MLRLRNTLFRTGVFGGLLLAQSVFAQTPQIDSEDVARVGSHLACQCGSCKGNLVCPMSKQGCGFCVPNKARIAKMQKAGMSDSTIYDAYKKEFGDRIYLNDPSLFYWLVPSLLIALGLLSIFWFVRRYTPRVPAIVRVPELDPKYREQIERETANLD